MGETYSMGLVLKKIKSAAAIAGVVWNVTITGDNEALQYVKDLGTYDRKRVEEQLRVQGNSDIADWVS